ncbi:type I-E CRISPR-associated protein Cas6/Cse3/CasE [Actinoplanes sp. NPDC051475]|uniref:type I-E CRISPR-associated protein Cas6/Cse3/CasE n=1 Tax=Actinoplanes sp. NPDC051475 TaxID=3157225 RepID=UPI00344C5094
MPYLSRIYLNPLRTKTQQFLRSPQALHAAILGGISRQPVTERVLWRLDTDNKHRATVLALTDSHPSWEHLIEQGGWPESDDPQALIRPYEALLDQIMRGRQFAMRLRANTVTATKSPTAPSPAQKEHLTTHPRPRGIRVPHRTAAHQLTWFTQRIEKWGFTLQQVDDVPAVQLTARERLQFTKHADDTTGRTVTLQTGTFDAVVAIDDPDRAQRSLLEGVGAGKAYGLGLITLAPPTTAEPH